MKRLILFSNPTESNLQSMWHAFFPEEIKNKVFAYMPSDGANTPQKYIDIAENWAIKHNAAFAYIDNSVTGVQATAEAKKLVNANILCITGGNTFTLLRNIRRSHLDKAIKIFAQKPEYVLGGFSAGAIVLTPSIRVASIEGYEGNDENIVGIKDLSGLGLVSFEVFPHFTQEDEKWAKLFEEKYNTSLKRISDNDIVIIDR